MTDDSQAKLSANTTKKIHKPFWTFLKQIAAYFWVGIRSLWPFWLFIVGLFGLATICAFVPALDCQEIHIRLLGMFLQLLGVLTVAKGLRDSARLFDKQSILESIVAYLKEVPRRRVIIHDLVANDIVTDRPALGRPSLSVSLGPDAPLEKRVEMLDKIISELSGHVEEIEAQLQAQCDNLMLSITDEATHRKADYRAIKEKLEKAVIGGIHVEWLGVIFFIAGIILASASPELASLLRNAGSWG